MSRPWVIATVTAALVLTFVLDERTDAAPAQHLYYLPIILAASRLSWIGGLATSVIAIVLYHLANHALLTFAYHEIDLVQIALFLAVGAVTARLTENARRLQVIAMTDDLTGLHNLRSFEVRLTAMIQGARSSSGSIAMLVLDLDKLKSLNDTYGHLTGAEAVRHVGRIIGEGIPPDAVACRYGGDEFAVSIAGRDQTQVRAIADLLCERVRRSAPVLAGRSFPAGTVTISIGVAERSWSDEAAAASASDTDAKAGELLFRSADKALYAAKSRGRNQVFVVADQVSGAIADARS
jgi:diguanylate cyclase (GGDEF)-like protein